MAPTISSYGMGSMMDNLRALGDAIARKGLHRGAIDVVLRVLKVKVTGLSHGTWRRRDADRITHVKCHPGDGLIMRNGSFLDQFQTQRLVIELDRVDVSRWCPGSDHQMMEHCCKVMPPLQAMKVRMRGDQAHRRLGVYGVVYSNLHTIALRQVDGQKSLEACYLTFVLLIITLPQ